MNGSNGQIVSTLATELSHYEDAKNGHEVSHQNGADETKAHFLTDVAADSWNTENQFNGYETNTSKVNQGQWRKSQTVDNVGNRTADSLINQNTIKKHIKINQILYN